MNAGCKNKPQMRYTKHPFLLTGLLLCTVLSAPAQAPLKRIYIANDDHTDYMWTGNEAQYDSAFVHMLDYYAAQIDSTTGHPDDLQARFNCDGNYWLRTYRKYRSEAQFKRLIGHIKSGHISVPLNSLVSVYGGQPAEAVLRGMFYAGHLRRKYGLQIPIAVSMENQTQPLGLASLWAGCGAKWSWKGVCACASRITTKRLGTRPHQMFRYTGTDGQGVLMKWYNYTRQQKGAISLGGYAEMRVEYKTDKSVFDNINPTVGLLAQYCDSTPAYPYRLAAAFGYGSDDLDTYISPTVINVARQATTQTTSVRVSNEEDFFRDFEQRYPKLPVRTLTHGNEWDLYPASMNETTAQVRRSTEKLRTAESLATLVAVKDSAFGKDLEPAKAAAWDAFGLYWEHDWTADGPVTRADRAAWQIKQKDFIGNYVDTLYNRAAAALGALIPAGTRQRVYAYNSLSWTRSDVADFLYDEKESVRVIDLTTGKQAASQVITKGGKKYLRIWAENIPAVGYKVYELQRGTTAKTAASVMYGNGILQNRFHRIKVEGTGAISEWYDRLAGNRQLVKADSGRLANDIGATEHSEGSIGIENEGPVSVTVKAVSANPIAHTVRVTLFANSPRIEIEDSINQNFADVKTWSFPFALTKPTTRYEEVGAVLTAKTEKNGGHYAAENARYDWLTFNHFADLSEAGYGITVSNQDCSFFGLGRSTPDSLHEASPVLNALAGGQIDGKELGIVAQNGNMDFLYRFALTAHRSGFDAAAAMRFSLEHQNPLATGAATGGGGGYPEKSFSFLSVSNPGVLLWSLKPSEEGVANGVVTRFWNVGDAAATPTVRTTIRLKGLSQITHLETGEQKAAFLPNGFRPGLRKQQMISYKLKF